MCFSPFLRNKILFLGAGNSVVLQVENFNDGWMRSFDSGSDEAALPGFFYDCSQQAFGDSPLSVSAVHPALWDKRRYGSLRGSSKGHYRRRRTPSSWGHKAREGGTGREKMPVFLCLYARMDEDLALRLCRRERCAPSVTWGLKPWWRTNECSCVCVFSYPQRQCLVFGQMSLSHLLKHDVVICRQLWVFVW